MKNYTVIATLAFFASMGLPGLSGFISEALVLIGSFNADDTAVHMAGVGWLHGPNIFKICTIIAASGVILTAAYLLWTVQRMFLGPLNEKWKDLPDVSFREVFTLAPLGVLVIVLGVYPMPILDLIGKTLDALTQAVVMAAR